MTSDPSTMSEMTSGASTIPTLTSGASTVLDLTSDTSSVSGMISTSDASTIMELTFDATTVSEMTSDDSTVKELTSDASTVSEMTSDDSTVKELTSGASTVSEMTSRASTVKEMTSYDSTVSEMTSGASTVSEMTSGASTVSEMTSGASTVSEMTSDASSVSELTSNSDASTMSEITSNSYTVPELTSDDSTVKELTSGASTVSEMTSDASTVSEMTFDASIVPEITSDVSTVSKQTSDSSMVSESTEPISKVSPTLDETTSEHYTTTKISIIDSSLPREEPTSEYSSTIDEQTSESPLTRKEPTSTSDPPTNELYSTVQINTSEEITTDPFSEPTTDSLTSDYPSLYTSSTSDDIADHTYSISEEPTYEPFSISEESTYKPTSISEEPTYEPSLTTEEPTFEPSSISDEPTFEPASISEEPNIVSSTSEMPTSEPSTSEVPTSESSTSEVPTSESSTSEVPTSESSTSEVPTSESSTPEVPTSESSTPEVPTSESSTPEVPTSESSTPMPTSESSTPEVPTSESSTPEVPTSESSTPEVPTSESSTPEVPTSESSTPEVPTSESSTPEVPTSESSTPESVNVPESSTLMPTSIFDTCSVKLRNLRHLMQRPDFTFDFPTSESNECPDGDGFFVNDDDCSSYIQCYQGISYKKFCPVGLYYNLSKRTCDTENTCGDEIINPTARNLDIECDCENCLYPDSDNCSKYYLCLGGIAFDEYCSNGLLFNPRSLTCDYEDEVECSRMSMDCSTLNNGDVPIKGKCGGYMHCVAGVAYEKECPAGLHFGDASGMCEDPCEAGCDPSIDCSVNTTTTTQSMICEDPNGFYPNPMDCRTFYKCTKGFPTLAHCVENEHFNPVEKICQEPCQAMCNLTIDCPNITSPSTERTTPPITTSETSPEIPTQPTEETTDHTTPDETYATSVTTNAEITSTESITTSQKTDEPSTTTDINNVTTKRSTTTVGDEATKESSTTIAEQSSTSEDASTTGDSFTVINTGSPSSGDLISSEGTTLATSTVGSTTTEEILCKHPHGAYPKPGDCHAFYLCVLGHPHVMSCGDMHFSPVTRHCERPCNAQCDPTLDCSTKEEPESSSRLPLTICPKRDIVPKPGHCEYYYDCATGIKRKHRCPRGLEFNPSKRTCDIPRISGCGEPPRHLPIPDLYYHCECDDCLVPSHQSCLEYFLCLNSTAYRMRCSGGLLFDKELNTCNYASQVICDDSDDSADDEKRRPPSSTTRPPPSTTRPPPSTTRPPPSTTRPPPSTTRPPPSTTRPPPSTTRPPPSTTRPPPSTTRPPPTTTRPPPPSSTTRPPPHSSTRNRPASTVRPTVRPTVTRTPTIRPTPTVRPTKTVTNTVRPTATPRPTVRPTPTQRPTAEDQTVSPSPKHRRCQRPNGMFRNPDDCGSFIHCANWWPYIKTCPGGLHFSPQTQRCDYPCEAKCDKSLHCTTTERPRDPVCTCTNCLLPNPESCTKYYKCDQDGQSSRQTCPRGQTFDSRRKVCDWAHRVDCDSSQMCPTRNGLFPIKGECHKFVHCADGIPYVKECPANLHFDPVGRRCEWPSGKCDPSSEKDPSEDNKPTTPIPTPAPEWRCPKSFGFFRSNDSCSRFYICSKGEPQLKECPKDLVFNSKYQTCDWPQNVNCNKDERHYQRRCRRFDHQVKCPSNRGSLPHPHCDMFFDCSVGKACAKKCPDGLYYNNQTAMCDLPTNVRCQKRDGRQYSLKAFAEQCRQTNTGQMRDPAMESCFYRALASTEEETELTEIQAKLQSG
ncbi:hypothetical protein JTE90_019029 [Oedothorax gibbosus]|uniref:Chitin-binding type-2 domain-containing protein n=1 Tax=Oedothorax gibbosus TaxID=931172 RepID=A0AAV6UYL5_9ARAC|nr:hypothetical protein JTE90_019029 [Oedothorax gibbosus]